MAGRGRGMVSKAKKAGGDGLLLTGEQTNGMGSYSTGSTIAFANGNTITTTGTHTQEVAGSNPASHTSVFPPL